MLDAGKDGQGVSLLALVFLALFTFFVYSLRKDV